MLHAATTELVSASMRWNFGRRGVSTTFGSKNFRVTLPVAKYPGSSGGRNGGGSGDKQPASCLAGCLGIVIGGFFLLLGGGVLLAIVGAMIPKQNQPPAAQAPQVVAEPAKTDDKPPRKVVLTDDAPAPSHEVGPDGLTQKAREDRAWNEWRMCDKLMRNGTISQATKERLERLVDRYPGTPAADKAKAVLESL